MKKQANKQANTKPLTPTQIKLLLTEMIRIHNEKVNKANRDIQIKRDKQRARYQYVLSTMFNTGGFTEAQIKRLVSRCNEDDDKLGVKAILKESKLDMLSHYKEKHWNIESHPLHAILERTKLRLHMGSAGDYETYLKEFTAEIEKLLK